MIIQQKKIPGMTDMDGQTIYKTINRRRYVVLFTLVILCAVSFITDVMTGVAMIPVGEMLQAIFQPGSVSQSTSVIIWSMRLPIACMALAVGYSLGMAGSVMQTILNNPLASPYTLGVGAGAAFGASLGILINGGEWLVSLLAFLFSMLICALIYLLGKVRGMSTQNMVLVGIALLFIFQALQALLQYASTESQNQEIVFWSFGSLQKGNWITMAIVAGVGLVCTPFILMDSWKYTALLMGDEKAESLGINVNRLKIKAFFAISLMSAVTVCFTGTIGFIGLAGPHIARMLVGQDQRFYIPVSAGCGALLLSVSSVLSKIIIPGTIFPIGIITSIIGVPFFFILVIRKKGV